MDQDLFFKNISDAFAFRDGEQLDKKALFKEHRNWSSMTSLLTISMFFSEYAVHVTADELVTRKTFQDLYDLVCEKMEQTCTA